MATRIVNSPGAQITITNRSAYPLVVDPVFLKNGQQKSFPLSYLSSSVDRAEEVKALLGLGMISVSFNNPDLGYVALGITDPNYFAAIEAPTAMSLGVIPVYTSGPGGTRPDANDVPEGFTIYNTTTLARETAIGAAGARAWV